MARASSVTLSPAWRLTKQALRWVRSAGQMCSTKVGVLLFTGSQTWLFSDNDWALQPQGATPPGRGAAALSAFGEGAIMFGGQGAKGFLADTWVWTAAEGWTMTNPGGGPDAPSPRSMHSLATADLGARDGQAIILYGGANTGEPRMTALNDTWMMRQSDPKTWYNVGEKFVPPKVPGTTIEHAASPPASWGHSMICHDASAIDHAFCMLFGGGVTQ